MVAAVCLLTTGLLTRVVVLHGLTTGLLTRIVALSGLTLTLDQNAMGKLARLWDDPKSPTYRSQPAQMLRLLKPDEPWVVEAAHRALQAYGILGPDDVLGAGDWRQRDDVRRLPAADRDDLELWIMERVYRYCRALDEPTSSDGDRRRALEILDQAGGPLPTPAFTPLRNRLLARLPAGDPPAPSRSLPVPEHPWLDEHLLGFVAECEEPEAADKPSPLGLTDVLETLKTEARKQRRAAERALGHYARSLALRPDSYWGHYRAAGMCYGLGQFAEAAGHLEECLQRRPQNPVLLGQLAGCLIALKRHPEALQLCDQALERAPEQAEFYRTRAFIKAKLGQTGGLADDLGRLETRRHTGDTPNSQDYRGPLSLEEWPIDLWPAQLGSRGEVEEIPSEQIEFRLQLTDAIRDTGGYTLAETELDKILRHNPDDFRTRMKRVEYAIKDEHFDDARREFDAVLNHPGLLDQLRRIPTNRFAPFFMVTHRYLKEKKVEEARMVAERARDLAIHFERDVAKSQYNLAQVYARMGRRSDPQFIKEAAKQLAQAFAACPYLRQWYRDDRWWLYPSRTQLDAELRQIKSHAEAGGRAASASPSQR